MKTNKGAVGFLTLALVLIVLGIVAFYLLNFVFAPTTPITPRTPSDIKSTEQVSQKTQEVGKTLQNIGTNIEDIERKLG